jgi:hypothetical protein
MLGTAMVDLPSSDLPSWLLPVIIVAVLLFCCGMIALSVFVVRALRDDDENDGISE